MIDSPSNPRAPKPSRRKPAREPATIDLTPNVVEEGARQEDAKPREDATPEEMREETIAAAAEPQPPAEDAVSSPEVTLDSGMGADSIGPEAPPQEPEEPLAQEEPPSRDVPPPDGSSQAAPARRTSSAALIGTGLLGGLVGAGIVYGVQAWMAPDPQDDQRIAQLEQRVSALGQQRAAPPQQGGDIQAIEGRLQAFESATASLDQRLQAVQAAAEQAAARAEEALNRPLPEGPAPQTDAALGEISNRLAALENQVQAGMQDAANAASTAAEALNAVQALDRRLAEQESRLAAQDERLAALAGQVTDRRENAETTTQAGIRVVLAERLSEALRTGAPYPQALEGLRRFEADPGLLAPLEPFAQAGAPTASALAQDFEPLGAAILRESRGPGEGWTDRLQRMMDRVVSVRPVNEPGSNSVPSLVARIEQALDRGDVAGAVAAWQTLPEPLRRISEDWGRRAQAVAQARQASEAIIGNALAALNQTAQ